MPEHRRHKTHWALNALLCVGSPAAALLAIELILRCAGYGRLEIYQPDPKLFWRLSPNQDCLTKVDRKPVHINSRGTRGPEFAEEKPPGTIRVLSLGDSRTFGWGLSDGETYSALLQEALQARFGNEARVEVINAGVNAWSFAQMKVFLQEHGLRYRPDVAVLEGANLWTQFSEHASPEFARAFMRRVRLKNLLRRSALYHWLIEVRLRSFYERHRTKFIPVVPEQDGLFKEQQRADPDARFREEIAAFCQIAISNGIRPVLLFLPTLDELGGAEAPRTLRIKGDVARALGVPVVDARDALRPLAPPPYLEADPVHLDARGNRAIVAPLADAIFPLLVPDQGGPRPGPPQAPGLSLPTATPTP